MRAPSRPPKPFAPSLVLLGTAALCACHHTDTLTVTVVPPVAGLNEGDRVTSTPDGIDCTGRCSHDFMQGTQVTLTAVPATDLTYFGGWSGSVNDCLQPSQRPSCTFQLQGAADVIASFSSKSCSSSGWCQEPLSDFSTASLRGIFASSADEVYVVGLSGLVLHLASGTWKRETSTTGKDLYAVWGDAKAHVYAVGAGGTVLMRDSTSGQWSDTRQGPSPCPTALDLNGVWGDGSGELWAVGQQGTILKWLSTGGGCTLQTSATHDALNAVWGTASEIWAVAATGTVYAVKAMQVYSPTTKALYAVGGSGDDTILAVGDAGTALRRHVIAGTIIWAAEDGTGTSHALRGVVGRTTQTGGTEIIAVGDEGTILHNDGSGWSAMQSGTTRDLYSIWDTGNDVWVAGEGGTVLHYHAQQ